MRRRAHADDDGGGESSDLGGRSVAPAGRRLTVARSSEGDCYARLDVLALQQQHGAIQRLCAAVARSDPSSSRAPNVWQFWLAYADSQCGESAAALAALSQLKGDAFALPVTALNLAIHSRAKVPDKELLASLKTSMRVVSKHHATTHSLLVAARYYLFANKLPKARQCIDKSIKKNKDDADLLNLFAIMDMRTPLDAEGDQVLERSRKIIRKAIKLGSASMNSQAASSDDAAAAPASSGSVPCSSLLLSSYARMSQLEFTGDFAKALREVEYIISLFPNYVSAWEWKAQLLAAQLEWKSCIAWCTQRLQMLADAAANDDTEYVEADSICLRWFVALHSLLTASSLSPKSDAHTKVASFVRTLLALEGRNAHLLFEAARNLVALARGEATILHLAANVLDRAMYAHRRCHPSSNHSEMSRMLCVQAELQLAGNDPSEALESFIEAFVMDESESEPCLGQVDALLQLRRFQEAKKLLADTLPEPTPDDAPAFRRSYFLAVLAWEKDANAEQAVGHLVDSLDQHMEMVQSRTNPPPFAAAPSIRKRAWNYALDADFFCTYAASTVLAMARLYLAIIGSGWKRGDFSLSPEELHTEQLLNPTISVLTHLSTIMQADLRVFLLLAQLTYIQRDFTACHKHVHRYTKLDESNSSSSTSLPNKEIAELVRLLKSVNAFDSPSHALAATKKAAGGSSNFDSPRPPQLTTPRSKLRAERERAAAAALGNGSPRFGRISAPSSARGAAAAAAAEAEDEEPDSALMFALDSDDEDPPPGSASTVERRRAKLHASLEADAEAEFAAVAARAAASGARTRMEQSDAARANEAKERARQADISKRAEEEVQEALASRKGSRVRTKSKSHSDKDLMGHSNSGSSLLALSNNSSTASLSVYSPAVPYLSHFRSPSGTHGHVLATSHSDKSVGYDRGAGAMPAPVLHATMLPSSSMSSLEYANNAMTPSHTSTTPSPHALTFDAAAKAFYYPLTHTVADRAHTTSSAAASASSSSLGPGGGAPRSFESALIASKKSAAASLSHQTVAAERFRQVAAFGASFWKHGRKGEPHQRTLELTCHEASGELRFDWGSDKMAVRRDDFQLLQGKQTDVLQRSSAARSKPELCFSIVGRHRTLDLEATSKELRHVWVDGLLNLVAIGWTSGSAAESPANSARSTTSTSSISGRNRSSTTERPPDPTVTGSSSSFFGSATGPPVALPASAATHAW